MGEALVVITTSAAWLPEPLLVALLQRGFATERAAVALAGHANAARDEMQCLADELHALAQPTSILTPAIGCGDDQAPTGGARRDRAVPP